MALALAAARGDARDEKPLICWDKPTGRLVTGGPDAYPLALAQLYASGQRADAVAGLEGWSEADMKAELIALRTLVREKEGRPPEDLLRAAVMLHTDREVLERLQAPVVESARECGIMKHAAYARSLVGLLAVETEASRDFARRWLTAMALSSQWDLCLDDVRRWTREGLKWFPRDAHLLLIQGTASETAAAMTAMAGPSSYGDRHVNARRKQELAAARRDLEAAVALDPELHEARVRLGRVLWRRGQLAESRAALEAALARSDDPWTLYLAHLFLGAVLEDSNDLPGAVEHFEAALGIDPTAQAAAVGLSQALLMQGEEVESRQVMTQALAHAPRPPPRDPYMSYHLGRANQAEEMLDALRAETLQ